MRKLIIILFVCLVPHMILADRGEKEFPIGICFIPEMEYIPELEDWKHTNDTNSVSVYDSTQFFQILTPHLKWIETQISSKLVRSLSRYAKKEMRTYRSVSPLSRMSFIPTRVNHDGFKILFEGTVDTLPTHSPIVTRWLKIFFVYDRATDSILRAIITIRGEMLE